MRTLLLSALALAACNSSEVPPATSASAEVSGAEVPVDAARVPPDEVATWTYREETQADLNGDGQPERLILTADAAVSETGEPVWDDGHRWAVYVEAADSTRTLLYAQFVQLGAVEVAVTGADGSLSVTVSERGPHRRQTWQVRYDGPGRTRIVGTSGGIVQDPMRDILEPAIQPTAAGI